MSFQGKQLSEEITELVVRLKEHHDDERKAGKFVPTKDPAGRTARAMGIGVATVKRIMSRYAQNEGKIVVRIPQRPGRPPRVEFPRTYNLLCGNLSGPKT